MRLAILDDDKAEGALLAQQLRRLGHGCFEFHDAEALRQALRRESFDLLVIDADGTGAQGAALLDWLHQALPSPPPVVLLGGTGTEGADAAIARPVDPARLTDTVSMLLQQRYGTSAAIERIAGHDFDHRDSSVRWDGTSVLLTAKEFGLALLLFRNLGRPLSRAHIMEAVWGRVPDAPSRTLDAHISQVRRRLQLVPVRGFRLASIYGFGYMLSGRS